MQTLTHRNAPSSVEDEVAQTVTGSRPFERPFSPFGCVEHHSWSSAFSYSSQRKQRMRERLVNAYVSGGCLKQEVLSTVAVGVRFESNAGMLWCFRWRYFRVAQSHSDGFGVCHQVRRKQAKQIGCMWSVRADANGDLFCLVTFLVIFLWLFILCVTIKSLLHVANELQL